MKILLVSDKVVEHLYSHNVSRYRGEIQCIIGCGDLPYYYLEYLQSKLDKPLYYVHGNHDSEKEYLADGSVVTGPLGGINLHGCGYYEQNLLLVGLEGSIRYRRGHFQYSQSEMWMNVFRLIPYLLLNKAKHGRYMDILVAHSPPFGIHNGDDHIHIGFKSFLWLMKVFKPRYLVHGHRHAYHLKEVVETQFLDTTVLNIYPYKILEIEVSA